MVARAGVSVPPAPPTLHTPRFAGTPRISVRGCFLGLLIVATSDNLPK